MTPIIPDAAFHIMEFLPVPVQFDICKTTRHRSKIRANAAARKIRRAIRLNRIRMYKSALLGTYTDSMQRSIMGLFLNSSQIEKLLDHILYRGDTDYIWNIWTMFLDERSFIPFSQDIKDSIILGGFLGWTNKKILRLAISKMDTLDVSSLRLCLGIN